MHEIVQVAMVEVSAVIVNYNGGDRLLEVIRSLKEQENIVLKDIILVDDASIDCSEVKAIQCFPDLIVHRQKENTRNANKLRNIGISLADRKSVV